MRTEREQVCYGPWLGVLKPNRVLSQLRYGPVGENSLYIISHFSEL